jgi:hypothetical protein
LAVDSISALDPKKEKKMSTSSIPSTLSVQVFGEKTSLPITVTKAAFFVTDPLPFLHKTNVVVELGLVNSSVPKDIAAKLRLVLPVGGSVKKFGMSRESLWYPATAVPEKKAKAIVYKEKEKGRAVASVSNVGAGSNIFEIEVSPMPCKQTTKCRLEVIVDNAEELIESMFSVEISTQVVVENVHSFAKEHAMTEAAGVLVGDSFGKTHFVCKIPPIVPSDSNDSRIEICRIAILWDTSASMAPTELLAGRRCARLRELLALSKANTIELYTFGVGIPAQLGTYESIDNLCTEIGNIEYDGGTDVTKLSQILSDFAGRADDKIDCVLVFTDGMDNLGRTPVFADSYDITFPVHCIADADEMNFQCLKTIAAASPTALGTVFTKKDDSYLKGVLFPQPVLRSIKTDQDEEAFLEETDDGFRCVPDHRLQVLNRPIQSDGLRIAGILKQEGREHCSVTKLIAEVVIGSKKHDFHFQLQLHKAAGDPMQSGMADAVDSQETTTHCCPTISLAMAATMADAGPNASTVNLARILGHLYAEELYREAALFGLKSGTDMKKTVGEDLAVSYGFCSLESSLLMLYDGEQFEEHGISPPFDHPTRQGMETGKEVKENEQAGHLIDNKAGEIGGLKNEAQRAKVTELSLNLKEFFAVRQSSPKVARVPAPVKAAMETAAHR